MLSPCLQRGLSLANSRNTPLYFLSLLKVNSTPANEGASPDKNILIHPFDNLVAQTRFATKCGSPVEFDSIRTRSIHTTGNQDPWNNDRLRRRCIFPLDMIAYEYVSSEPSVLCFVETMLTERRWKRLAYSWHTPRRPLPSCYWVED